MKKLSLTCDFCSTEKEKLYVVKILKTALNMDGIRLRKPNHFMPSINKDICKDCLSKILTAEEYDELVNYIGEIHVRKRKTKSIRQGPLDTGNTTE